LLLLQVRDNAAIVSKVSAVGGDISQAGLGLAVEDRAMLLSSLDFIIHCAADIRLEADIQVRPKIYCFNAC
jgi:thioester reductase-like protein